MSYVWCVATTVFLRENQDLDIAKSTLINREVIIAALATLGRGYLRYEVLYPVVRGTRGVCDMPYDPELKSLVMESFLGS